MSTKTTIYLVRHGQSESNKAGLVSGQSNDPELTDEGRRQVLETREHLKHIGHDAVYASDLRRAVQTAEIIHGKELPKSAQRRGLREKNFGNVDGKSRKYLEEIYYKTLDMPEDDRWDYRHSPDAETDGEVASRFLSEVAHLADEHKGETIILVTHGYCIRTSLMKLGYGKHEDFPPGSFSNAGHVVLDYDGKNFTVKKVVGHTKPPSR